MKEASIPDLLEDDILVEISYSAVNDYDWSLSTGNPFFILIAVWLMGEKRCVNKRGYAPLLDVTFIPPDQSADVPSIQKALPSWQNP